MPKFVTIAIFVAMTSVAAAGCSGCATWWQNFIANPVAQVQTFEQTVQVALNDAQIAWPSVVPFLPAAQSAAISLQFTNAVAAVNHALALLNDAVQAAVAAQTSDPDFSALMVAVSDAVGQVVAIIAEYTQASSDAGTDAGPTLTAAHLPLAANVPGFQDLQMQSTMLKKWITKRQ